MTISLLVRRWLATRQCKSANRQLVAKAQRARDREGVVEAVNQQQQLGGRNRLPLIPQGGVRTGRVIGTRVALKQGGTLVNLERGEKR